jgi:hypothetical protein
MNPKVTKHYDVQTIFFFVMKKYLEAVGEESSLATDVHLYRDIQYDNQYQQGKAAINERHPTYPATITSDKEPNYSNQSEGS